MINTNLCVFTGNLTRDPEIKQSANGNSICKFAMAVNDDYKEEKCVHFIDFVAFGKLSDVIAQHCQKGHKLLVISKAQKNTWKTESGENRSKIEFVVQSFEFLTNKNSAPQQQDQQQGVPAFDDIPHPAF